MGRVVGKAEKARGGGGAKIIPVKSEEGKETLKKRDLNYPGGEIRLSPFPPTNYSFPRDAGPVG